MRSSTTINKLYDQERVDVMTWLRFPLILGVILIHSNLFALVTMWEGTAPDWPEWLVYIFNNFAYLVLPPRVPILFIISGYFFFRSQKNIDKRFFIDKYKRRVNSLLIPYIAWNTIAIVILYIRFNIIAGENYTFFDYISGYWDFIPRNRETPADGPLWFIRDLMMVSIITPVLYIFLRRRDTGLIFLILFSVCYMADIYIPFTGLSNVTIFFFSIGSYIAIHNIDFTKIPHKFGIILILLYVPIQILQDYIDPAYQIATSIFSDIIKTAALLYAVSFLFKKNILKPTPRLTKISFLLYAIHGIIIGPILKSLYIILDSNNPYILLGIYIATPCIIIGITFITYNLLSKYTPALKRILLGNRN